MPTWDKISFSEAIFSIDRSLKHLYKYRGQGDFASGLSLEESQAMATTILTPHAVTLNAREGSAGDRFEMLSFSWRATSSNATPHPAIKVSLPALELDTSLPPAISTALHQLLSKTREALVKAYLSDLPKDKLFSLPVPGTWDTVEDVLAAWQAEEETSNRLTEDQLLTWFSDSGTRDRVFEAFAAMPEADQATKASTYFASFKKLLAPQPGLYPAALNKLRAYVSAKQDPISSKLCNRIDTLLAKFESDEAGL